MIPISGFVKFAAISFITCITILVILNKWDVIIRNPIIIKYANFKSEKNITSYTPNVITTTSVVSIIDAVARQHDLLYEKFANFRFPRHLNLDDLTMTTGGRPIRSIVLTTWKGGSTFLADILNTLSGNFYYDEPLRRYGMLQIREPPLAEDAVNHLKRLLECDYSFVKETLNSVNEDDELFKENFRLLHLLKEYPRYRRNGTFLSEICKLFPFQSMKLLRLRLRFAEKLLENRSLKVRILLIVRDPRAIMLSRKDEKWCRSVPDCDQAELLCIDMVSDYDAAVVLKEKYPERFMIIKYENLSLHPSEYIRRIISFFGLHFHKDAIEYLTLHTKKGDAGETSTHTISKTAAFRWRVALEFPEIRRIQEECTDAMKVWGYVEAKNESELWKFDPLGQYEFN